MYTFLSISVFFGMVYSGHTVDPPIPAPLHTVVIQWTPHSGVPVYSGHTVPPHFDAPVYSGQLLLAVVRTS